MAACFKVGDIDGLFFVLMDDLNKKNLMVVIVR